MTVGRIPDDKVTDGRIPDARYTDSLKVGTEKPKWPTEVVVCLPLTLRVNEGARNPVEVEA